MPLLSDKIASQVRDVFNANLQQPVELLYFGRQQDCDYCDDNRQLLEEVTALHPTLHLITYDLDANADVARQYGIADAPATVIAARDEAQDGTASVHDYGIRLLGIPSGHEFGTLIQDLIVVSGRDSGLEPATRAFLSNLQKPIHLQVFVTPT